MKRKVVQQKNSEELFTPQIKNKKIGEHFRLFKLDPGTELRFEVEFGKERVLLELESGMAEIFGAEIIKGITYEFYPGAIRAVYTWHGCVIKLSGNPDTYTTTETSMDIYFNCHRALESMRNKAEKEEKRGPITMVVGPPTVGRATLSKLLLSYGARMRRKVLYVDLNVAQNKIGIPGSMGALLVEKPADVSEGLHRTAPLVFHFGHTSPDKNTDLYSQNVTTLAKICKNRLEKNRKIKTSGMMINTCGWVREDRLKLIKHTTEAFEVDVIFVLDQERLYYELKEDLPESVKVINLPKSGGAVKRDEKELIKMQGALIEEYFYGVEKSLFPYCLVFKFSEVQIHKAEEHELPNSCLPLDETKKGSLAKLVPVPINANLLYSMLSISSAKTVEEDVLKKNVLGFLCVTDVDMKKEELTLLCPQPKFPQDNILLLSNIHFMDYYKMERFSF